ncbi:MAG: aspartate racemase [Myxococcota bacterium]|jgi:aspartate racemase
MKTLGLLGGMTWHSTATYYTRINQRVAATLGPKRSASIVMHSIDYDWIIQAQRTHDWKRFATHLRKAATGLQRSGAQGLVVCSNTIHRLVPSIRSQISIPVLHIVDALIAKLQADRITCVALFGTAFTMTERFYIERLTSQGIRVIVPELDEIVVIDRIVLGELSAGRIEASSRQVFAACMARLEQRGAQAMVLGCTEIGLLIGPGDVDVPVYDTALIHADAAADWAMKTSEPE